MGTEPLSVQHVGRIVRVRQRQYLVDDVSPGKTASTTIARLSCVDPDHLGRPLEVIWEQELDAEIPDGGDLGAARRPGLRPSRPVLGLLPHAPLEPGDGLADRPAPGPVPGRDRHRALPARAVADGPRHAPGQPLHRRRRRARQDDRGRADRPRAAPPPQGLRHRRLLPAVDAPPVARGDGGPVRAALPGRRPGLRPQDPQGAGVQRQPLGDPQPVHHLAQPDQGRGIRLRPADLARPRPRPAPVAPDPRRGPPRRPGRGGGLRDHLAVHPDRRGVRGQVRAQALPLRDPAQRPLQQLPGPDGHPGPAAVLPGGPRQPEVAGPGPDLPAQGRPPRDRRRGLPDARGRARPDLGPGEGDAGAGAGREAGGRTAPSARSGWPPSR